MSFLTTRFVSPPVDLSTKFPKAIGDALTATGYTPWVPVWNVPNVFFAQIEGTSGAQTATCQFQFSDDGKTIAGKGSTISLSGTGAGSGVVCDGDCDKSVSPWIPWKFVRLYVSAIAGTGAKVHGKQALGAV